MKWKDQKGRWRCPFCRKVIVPDKEFTDKLSRIEFEISGLCQGCQDKMFKPIPELPKKIPEDEL